MDYHKLKYKVPAMYFKSSDGSVKAHIYHRRYDSRRLELLINEIKTANCRVNICKNTQALLNCKESALDKKYKKREKFDNILVLLLFAWIVGSIIYMLIVANI